MLKWFRFRRQVEEVHGAAMRPINGLQARQPTLFPGLWQVPYCCTLSYFWTAVIAEDVCQGAVASDEKYRTLREAFTRMIEASGGRPYDAMKRVLPDGHPVRRRALIDLKRVVDLYHGKVDDRHMIYPEYREAVQGDGRPAPEGNRFGLRREFSHEILLSAYLAGNSAAYSEREAS
jgi:hypothetical protein